MNTIRSSISILDKCSSYVRLLKIVDQYHSKLDILLIQISMNYKLVLGHVKLPIYSSQFIELYCFLRKKLIKSRSTDTSCLVTDSCFVKSIKCRRIFLLLNDPFIIGTLCSCSWFPIVLWIARCQVSGSSSSQCKTGNMAVLHRMVEDEERIKL